MNKKRLKQMNSLKATPEMMQMAAADKPRQTSHTRVKYHISMYMRCCLQNDILKVAIFLSEAMRTGGQEAVYEVFLSHKERTFLTYDRIHDKWLTSKLDMLSWPSYAYYDQHEWISDEDSSIIKEYIGSSTGDYDAILSFQRNIRADELIQRYKRITDTWDNDLARTPPLPKDWERWVSKVGITDNFIFYRYDKKGAKTGYCTYCERDVSIKNPRNNAVGHCPRCGRPVTYKSEGKAGTIVTDSHCMYLLQRCKDGFIIREFSGCHTYAKGNYRSSKCSCREVRRVIYDEAREKPRAYYMGLYRQRETRWILTGVCRSSWCGTSSGYVYGKTIPSLEKSLLRKTGLPEMIRAKKTLDPEHYLSVLAEFPQLEQIVKAGLVCLATECISKFGSFREYFKEASEGKLTRILGVNTAELKRLRQNNGGKRFLQWMHYEKASGSAISDNAITWFCRGKIMANDLSFIQNRMSMQQICNYLRRQIAERGMNCREVLTTWSDYLSMAKRFGLNTNDEIVYRVRKLRERHDALVQRSRDKPLVLRAGEVLIKYPNVDSICQGLKEKYEYANDRYAVVVPTCIEDILQEGDSLSHCLAGSARYWERIERHETYILFLRKASAMEKAYYTLEVEPSGTVRQTRTEFDRQEADFGDIKGFLTVWQKVVSERLTAQDKIFAEHSRILRDQEYTRLRNDRIIIKTGELAGSLLVDVLLGDLMETAA